MLYIGMIYSHVYVLYCTYITTTHSHEHICRGINQRNGVILHILNSPLHLRARVYPRILFIYSFVYTTPPLINTEQPLAT